MTQTHDSTLPPEIHERVLDFAHRLVHASAAADQRQRWRLHGELRDYCDCVAASGGDHPFLWESLADFTTDDRIAIPLYERALVLARALDAHDYEASILLAMALRHASLGAQDEAYEHARRADEVARHLDDLDLRREISRFLLELSSHG